MNHSRPLVASLAVAALAALALVVSSCASGEGSSSEPAGPTVKVSFVSEPTAAVVINGKDVGITPCDVNLPVDETTGFLKYDLRVSFDANKTMGNRGASQKLSGGSGPSAGATLSWVTGKHLPAKITSINNNVTESRDYAKPNPPGTKSDVSRE